MTDTIWVAILSLVGTLAGSFGGIMASNKLVNFRLQQLENKVNAHNQVIDRTYKLEGQMREVEHEIVDLKKYHMPH